MSEDYYVSLNLQASVAIDCAQLQRISDRIIGSLNHEIASINAGLSNVNAIYNTVNDIYLTIAALETASSNLTALPALASGLTTLPQVIAFCQTQATLVAATGFTINASVVKAAIRLVSDLSMLSNQITALTNNLHAATTGLANFEATVASVASKFPSCTISIL